MATLDDKLLGEKLHYYCSSSEGEDEPEPDQESQPKSQSQTTSTQRQRRLKQLPSTNTGPKGVIEDWQRFKQLEAERRDEQDKEKLKLIEKLSLTCRSHLDMKNDEKQLDDELDELNIENDIFMKEYMKKRMQEMLDKTNIAKKTNKRFGVLEQLRNGDEFLNAIEKDVKDVSVICHIFNDSNEICSDINNCLISLAKSYPYVKFCAVHSRDAGVSKDFNENGVPALLVYKNGNLIGNFIRVSDEIGEEIKIQNVEAYLIQHGILPDKIIPGLLNDI